MLSSAIVVHLRNWSKSTQFLLGGKGWVLVKLDISVKA